MQRDIPAESLEEKNVIIEGTHARNLLPGIADKSLSDEERPFSGFLPLCSERQQYQWV